MYVHSLGGCKGRMGELSSNAAITVSESFELTFVISKLARVIFRPGSSHGGYSTGTQVVKQLEDAIKIAQATFPNYTPIFKYDDAPSHMKLLRQCPKER
jgi:hypothetical protein